MNASRIPTTANAVSLVAAPFAGLIAVLAHPALRSTDSEQLAAVGAHSALFYIYALGILISSILLVPALFGIMSIVRSEHPRAYVAGAVAQLGMLIAIGDAATELMFWQMGAGNSDAMTALAERYEASTGVSMIYNVGALSLIGVIVLAVVLWRARLAPRWAAAAVVACLVLNIAGFSMSSKPILVASYLVMLAGFTRLAMIVLRPGESTESVVVPTAVPVRFPG